MDCDWFAPMTGFGETEEIVGSFGVNAGHITGQVGDGLTACPPRLTMHVRLAF